MADLKLKYGTTQTLTVSGFNSLAGGSVAVSSDVDNTTDLFVDVLIEVTVAEITEATNRQVVVWATSSVDGTNFSEGVSGNRANMALVGSVPIVGTGPHRSKAMSLAAAFGGVVPPKWRLVLHNDNGSTALASSGNSVQYRGVHWQSV